jgi:F0F1-type ATP synthase epsilon subunit
MSDEVKPVMRQDASTGEMVEDKTATEEAAKGVDSKKPVMAIKVYAPFQVYYEGEGYSISGINETGPFDILPHHHNFICMLVPCELVIKTPYEVKRVKISRALMHVKAEKVTVFVDV